MVEAMLTTVDNPYNPFEDFDAWYAYDLRKGYFTCSFLARVAPFSSPDLSELDQNEDNESAIDEIIFENVLGLYRKVTREVPINK